MGLTQSSSAGHKGKPRAGVVKELERFTKPTGLYPNCPWDEKAVRRLILEGKLAPRFPGLEEKHKGTKECPLCMLYYVVMNRSKCCRKPICTECYLQVKKPRGAGHRHRHQARSSGGGASSSFSSSSSSSSSSPCPYCNQRLSAVYGVEDEEKMAAHESAYLKLYNSITQPQLPSPSIAGALEKGGKEWGGDEAAVGATGPVLSPSSASSSMPGSLFARAAAAAAAAAGTASNSKKCGGSGIGVRTATPMAVPAATAAAGAATAVPVATVKARQQIEDLVRKQHLEVLEEDAARQHKPPHPPPSPGEQPTAGAGGGGGPTQQQQPPAPPLAPGSHRAELRRALLQSLGLPDAQGALHQVEELLLMEAIRQSIREHAAASGLGAESGGGGGVGRQRLGLGLGFGQQEEEGKEEGGAEAEAMARGVGRRRTRGGSSGSSSTQQPRPASLRRGSLSFLRRFSRQESSSSAASSTTST